MSRMQTRPKIFYTAEASVTGGRDGHARSSDGKLDVNLRRPTEMGGDGNGTNPEQLFAAGYAACFMGALGVEHEQAQHLVDKAHEVCPYSNATRGNIPVDISVN